MSKKKELEPCPFCGIKRKIEVGEDDMFFVQCLKCGTRTDYYLYEVDAIAAWNSRHPDKELVEATFLLTQIVDDLPTNKDWLCPSIERQAKEFIAKHKKGQ